MFLALYCGVSRAAHRNYRRLSMFFCIFFCFCGIHTKANLRDGQYDATLLHWAVNEGHVPTVEHLLSCGADVRLRDGKQ